MISSPTWPTGTSRPSSSTTRTSFVMRGSGCSRGFPIEPDGRSRTGCSVQPNVVSLIPKPGHHGEAEALLDREALLLGEGRRAVGDLDPVVALARVGLALHEDRDDRADVVERVRPHRADVVPELAGAEPLDEAERAAEADRAHRRVRLRVDVEERQAAVERRSAARAAARSGTPARSARSCRASASRPSACRRAGRVDEADHVVGGERPAVVRRVPGRPRRSRKSPSPTRTPSPRRSASRPAPLAAASSTAACAGLASMYARPRVLDEVLRLGRLEPRVHRRRASRRSSPAPARR